MNKKVQEPKRAIWRRTPENERAQFDALACAEPGVHLLAFGALDEQARPQLIRETHSDRAADQQHPRFRLRRYGFVILTHITHPSWSRSSTGLCSVDD